MRFFELTNGGDAMNLGAFRDALRDRSPMAVQDDGVTAMTCGCVACCATKIEYTPTNGPREFESDFSSMWAFQADTGAFQQSMAPNDGPQEVNEAGGDVIPGSVETTFTLTLGQTETGTVNTDLDRDWFRVELVAGQTYVFTLTGVGGTPLVDPYLELRSEFGVLQAIDDDGGPGLGSRIAFTAATSGTYYINARAFDNANQVDAGDYEITFNTGSPQNPLDALDFNYQFPDNTINVYFTTTGETFGDTAVRNWTQAEINSVMSALASISAVTPLVFTQVFSSVGSDFRLNIADLASGVLGRFFIGAGNGSFDPDGAGWSSAGMAPGSLGYSTIVHEILHGLGLAHPHDNGGFSGGSQILQGVTMDFNSYGTFLMNQGVFTTMSYNDGWVSPFGLNTSFTTGSQGGPMALDIAFLQSLYGSTTANTGNNVYALTATAGAYLSIWDTGGVDTIQFASGAQNATIDLRAASLQTAFGGGGFVSYVFGFHAGWTIANGVVIENATGASGNDTLIGNDVANVLTGNNGGDTLVGNGGDDILDGGAGVDSMAGGLGNDLYYVDSSSDSITENSGEGIDSVIASSSLTLADNVENLTLTGTANNTANGNALNNLIIGNSGNNFMFGGPGADMMQGGAGNDDYSVDNVGDTVVENASEGTDRVFASVTFTLGANVENLTLTGVNAINGYGNALANTLFGNDAANTLDGGVGADSMSGGLGNDNYYVDNAGDTVTEDPSSGTDTVYAAIAYTLGAEVENLILELGAQNGTGNTLNNTITGNGANNILDGGAGADTLIGGTGDDTYVVDNASDVVTEGASAGTDVVQASVTFSLTANIENLTLTGGAAITGYGNILNNTITGNGAANSLYGFDGADTLDGSGGADSMFGGNGDDVYYVDHAGDVTSEVSALGGVDTVYSSVNRNLNANIENLTLTGGATLTGAGNSLNNVIIGNSGANTLYGFDGNDRLDGGLGADTLFGAAGDDVYVVDDVNDITVEGIAGPAGGIDTVESSISRNLNANFENMILTGSATTAYGNVLGNTLTGNALANSLYGFDGNDTLDGGAGADQMFGANGDDTYIVDNAGDVTSEVSALGGVDTVISSVARNLTAHLENLVLTGSADITGAGNSLNNVITGNAGANTLYGLDGNDRLDGGLGADVLQGGLGADEYVFSAALGAGNIDTIVGFNVTDDSIELDVSIFTGISIGALAAEAFVIGTAAADSDDRIIYDPTTGALYYDADGDGGGAAVQFATLATGLALTHNDFLGGP